MIDLTLKDVFLRNTAGLEEYLECNTYKRIRERLQERRFTAGDVGIPYRVLNHWDSKGLLPEGFRQTKKGWRKFSFVEMTWLEVSYQLRHFGVSLNDLKHVKDTIMDWDEELKEYSLFEFYIAKAFASEDDPYVFLFSDGKAGIGTLADLEANKLFVGVRSVVQVSLKEILKHLGFDVIKQGVLMSVSDPEINLLSAIRDKSVSRIVIKNKNGKLQEIETSEMISENPDLRIITKEIADTDAFADVIMKFSGGKAQSAEVKKKQRL